MSDKTQAASRVNSPLTPPKIIEYLDRYIVGQDKAKRAVAVALRNRLRRRALSPEMAHEVVPKNILMVGPTGVGKTEIARRLATLTSAPFIKVEATKFTEVGYVGRDVETIIRDLTESAVAMVKKRMLEDVQAPARERAEERLLDALLPKPERRSSGLSGLMRALGHEEEKEPEPEPAPRDDGGTRARLAAMLRSGRLDDREVEVDISDNAMAFPIFGMGGMEGVGINITDMLSGIIPKRTRKRAMKVKEALRVLQAEEADKLIDTEALSRGAVEAVQEDGIVFLDELDKVAAKGGVNGPDVSREGVQRDLLPIVEGSVVQTRYGPVKTDHILFIAAGAFSGVKPSDLIPELQGRFPIRVELEPLSWESLMQILTEPENSLIRQYTALLATEGVELEFPPEATEEIAKLASRMNAEMEDIGARRLHTVMEQLLEEISFNACGEGPERVVVTPELVRERLNPLVEDRDIRRYLL